jgi:hypothetical protein
MGLMTPHAKVSLVAVAILGGCWMSGMMGLVEVSP